MELAESIESIESIEPTVVNVKTSELKKKGFDNFDKWSEDKTHLYVGRDMSKFVNGAKASKWQNPFKVTDFTREQVLEKYEDYVRESNLINQLSELDGKVLGCWCHPLGCHGHVLQKLHKEMCKNRLIKNEQDLLVVNNYNFPPL